MAVTLTTLITRVREEANMEDSNFVSDTEITTYINTHYKALHGLLVKKFEDYFITESSDFTLTTNDAGKKAVAADFFKLLGVDRKLGTDHYVPLKTFTFRQRNSRTGYERGYCTRFRYRLLGSDLHFTPKDGVAGETFRYWYVPLVTELSTGSDEMDGVNGWEEIVVVESAIDCLAKEESDTTTLEQKRARLYQRIEIEAADRDEGEPQRIQDVRGYFDDDYDPDVY